MKIIHEQRGVAIFTAMMLIMLISGVSLFVLQNATTEKLIAAYVKKEMVSLSLAEAGIEQAISWMDQPNQSKNKDFFSKRACAGSEKKPDFSSKGHPIFPSDNGEGNVTIQIYHEANHPDGRCTVAVSTAQGKEVRVDLDRPPMPKMTAAVQGRGATTLPGNPVQWCPNPCLVDDFRPLEMDKLKPFIKRYGRSFEVPTKDCLREDGVGECQLFKQLFSVRDRTKEDKMRYDLVYINSDTAGALDIGPGPYRGYFFFTGDLYLEGSDPLSHLGMEMNAKPPNDPITGMSLVETTLPNIDVDGLFYTPKKIILNEPFHIYGALYAGEGFRENLENLQVWYNSAFASGTYQGVVPMIRVPGSWETM